LLPSIMLQVSCLLVRHTSLSIGSITNARDAVRTIHSTVGPSIYPCYCWVRWLFIVNAM
jgi:hypothetical protein